MKLNDFIYFLSLLRALFMGADDDECVVFRRVNTSSISRWCTFCVRNVMDCVHETASEQMSLLLFSSISSLRRALESISAVVEEFQRNRDCSRLREKIFQSFFN